uniref:Uncharacterized protein n=1 Tax=Arundo donax TaxID=35708 RepID=A0A0A9HDE0_ARUDO
MRSWLARGQCSCNVPCCSRHS